MGSYGAWEILEDDSPRRLTSDSAFLEKHLENWIQREPSLLRSDVRWVARQLYLPDGSRLDLLGLSEDGRWVVVELKAGGVSTGTVLQAMHYFLQLDTLSNADLLQRIRAQGIADDSVIAAQRELVTDPEDSVRDYVLMVAGVGSGESAVITGATLARYGFSVPVQVVSFQLLVNSRGDRLLIREVDDEVMAASSSTPRQWPLDNVLAIAEQHGVREGFERVRSELLGRGYRAYQRKNGLNFNLNSRLQCLWVKPVPGKIHFGYLESNFPALFGVSEDRARSDLGQNWLDLPPEEALERVKQWADIIEAYRAEESSVGQTPESSTVTA